MPATNPIIAAPMYAVSVARRRFPALCVLCLFCVLPASHVAAAQRQGRGGAEGSLEQPVTPGEIQRMFDSYALMQAQDQLKISDDRFPQFLTRFKALQDVRRRTLQERARTVQELRQLVNAPQPDEAQLKDRLKALADLEGRAAEEIRKAQDAIDQVLDVRQQAKFRVFEETMERRKLELVTRARQANRKQQQ
jgi:Spy/CpxP family protein refolding chaperone